ncbi:SDR family NAD(P)-dependent oxidoreductase [Actinomyces howellii]|uniref:NADP-dependent 3-hydroxy acid dehydrogenase YdfG n=1 Tax=Actinomyces howellii TaxID=52771 RepID=A0A448HH10_9ACTO|nr:SDR family NAD(P)-dependent oxidoreductase [Actinomyces howellii]VEG28249.1 NADP-dependent 3-hydroxy acid dehydrogenase YdfG [Actinomyces howellii]
MGTALITGATAGIGLEIAWQLAQAHHDLVVVARDEDRLNQVATELHQLAGVGVQVLPADLSAAAGRRAVADRLRQSQEQAADATPAATPASSGAGGRGPRTAAQVAVRPVDLLVNNAGFAVGQPFASGSIEQERRALDVMVGAVMELTHAAVPGMVERGHGAVLNIASVTALTAMGTYAAHKAWVRTFTEGLASELRGTGVTATVVNPGLTHSEFHARAGMEEGAWPGIAWLRAEDVACEALAAVRRGQVICTPSARYQAVNAALRLSPRWLVRRVAGHASVRTRY